MVTAESQNRAPSRGSVPHVRHAVATVIRPSAAPGPPSYHGSDKNRARQSQGPAARHRVSSSLRPRCSVGLDCSKFASADNGRCRLWGANDTQSTGIDRLQQEVIRYAKHCRPTEHGTQPDTAGSNQNRLRLISGSGVRNPEAHHLKRCSGEVFVVSSHSVASHIRHFGPKGSPQGLAISDSRPFEAGIAVGSRHARAKYSASKGFGTVGDVTCRAHDYSHTNLRRSFSYSLKLASTASRE